jgi:hypothetical protein
VLVTHGFTDTLTRLLQERGVDAAVLPTRFAGEAPPDAAVVDGEDGDNEDGAGDGDQADPHASSEPDDREEEQE